MSILQRKKNYRYTMKAKKKRFVMTARIRPRKPDDHASSRLGEETLGGFRLGE